MSLSWLARLLPCAVLLIASTDQAQAGIIFDGKTIGYQYLWPDQSTVYFDQDITVGAGVERADLYTGGDYATIDVSDTNILIDYYTSVQWNDLPFNGLRFFDKYNVLPAFSAATVSASTNLSGFSQSNVTYDQNNIYINWRGLSANANTIVSIDVARLSPAASSLPEPASLAVLGVGGIGLAVGGMRRRRLQAK